jgi:TRAP-type mannitol/chloroaromatic compound transport system substrate-binding protein
LTSLITINEKREYYAMKRREFLKAAGLATGVGIASPAIAQSSPTVKWRLQSIFPKSLRTQTEVTDLFARSVYESTDGRFEIQILYAGEIVGPFQALDAVGNNTVEAAFGASYFYTGKDPAFALMTAIPFGPNTRQQNAWMYEGGGTDLANEFYAKFNIYALPGGNTGTQMGGWYRKEINSVEEIRGLKIRIAGIGGNVLAKLGGVPQQLAAGDIYPALERGVLDAAEWANPYDDEALGFYRVAPYYYYPSWWEGQAMLHYFFNKQKWDELPKGYKAAVTAAAAYSNAAMTAKGDSRNPAALRSLVAKGAQPRVFKPEIMQAARVAADGLYEDMRKQSPDFAKLYDSMRQFRDEQYFWFQVAEYAYDNFMIRSRRT